jgi:hypothetical protein
LGCKILDEFLPKSKSPITWVDEQIVRIMHLDTIPGAPVEEWHAPQCAGDPFSIENQATRRSAWPVGILFGDPAKRDFPSRYRLGIVDPLPKFPKGIQIGRHKNTLAQIAQVDTIREVNLILDEGNCQRHAAVDARAWWKPR